VSCESNGVAEWLCPLCQKRKTDRSSLSLHLTEQHSVLPSCVDKLLDIVSMARLYGRAVLLNGGTVVFWVVHELCA